MTRRAAADADDEALASPRRPTRWESRAVVLTFAFHLAWELGQSSLFAEIAGVDHHGAALLAACLAGAVGDVVVAAAAFAFVARAVRDRDWPVSERWGRAALAWISLGVVAAVVIEIVARGLGIWSYTSEMPVAAGVGLSPMLQWVVVPALTLLMVRLCYRRGRAA